MERRGRSKSKNRKSANEKSHKKKNPDPSPAPVSRGRPRKKPEDKKPKPTPSRSRSRSVSVTRKRAPSKTRSTPSKKKQERLSSDDDQPSIVLKDIARTKDLSSRLDDVIRRSMSREAEAETLRRSTRYSERISSAKKEQWVEKTITVNQVKASTKKVEFGGWAGALAHVIIFLLIIGATLLGCTKDQCELKPFHIPRNWRFYFNLESSIGVVSFILLQAVLSILPIGRVVKSIDGNSSYRANGFLAVILTGLLVGGAWYLKYPVTSVYEKWISAAVTSYIAAWVMALVLCVKGSRAPVPGLNPYGNSGNIIYDLVAGREINPTLFGVINVKILLFRVAIIGSMLVDGLFLLKGYEVRREVSPTLTTLVILKALYCLDGLWFEEAFSSTFEVQYEGTGLLATQGYLLYPYIAGLLTRFVLQQRVNMPAYSLALSVVVYLIGFTLYRASNLQKATFRKNPLDPAIAHLQTINTARGKKLLVSGWWGKVKHPNYLGDIILNWALATTVGFTHAIPYVFPLITTVFLIHRAARDDKRCSERYLGAWNEYSKRVPYRIFPKLY